MTGDRNYPLPKPLGGRKPANFKDLCPRPRPRPLRSRHNAVRLQLHALAYNLANFMRTLGLPKEVEHWWLTTIRKKLVKIGAKVIAHGRCVSFQMAEVAVPGGLFRKILNLIDGLRRPSLAPG
jgi:hypothetical protein